MRKRRVIILKPYKISVLTVNKWCDNIIVVGDKFMKLSISERFYSKDAVKGFKEYKKAKELEHDGINGKHNYVNMHYSENPFYKASKAYTDAYNYFSVAKIKAEHENNQKMKESFDAKIKTCKLGIKKTEGLFEFTNYDK